jgi:ferredoxin
MARIEALRAALRPYGLQLRGGFCPQAHEAVALPEGRNAALLVLVGNVGGAMWPVFAASPMARDGQPHPLDRWSRQVGDALAQHWGAIALYPFSGPPAQPHYHPFQQWAARCETVFPSPMMLRLHPQHGLWHAYRFALAFTSVEADDRASLLPGADAALPDANPCLACIDQPCLHACPVQAYDGQQFAQERCRAHVRDDATQTCLNSGCQARNACPVAPLLRYVPAQARFHMQAFLSAAQR